MTARRIMEDARLTAVLGQLAEGRRPDAVGPTVEAVGDARRIMATMNAVGGFGQAEVYSVADGDGPEEFVFITGPADRRVVLLADCSCHADSICAHLLVALAHHGGEL